MDTFISGQSLILEKIAAGAALSDVLERLVWLVELQSTEMLCSVLLLDDDGLHLRHGAAPSLPDSYVRAIDGIAIGPKAGSCGTAAYQATTVIVTNIERDPLWDDYRELAAEHGFRACWSSPILSHTGQVLGTFAMYYRTPRGPLPEEQRLSEIAIHIASIAIENRRAEESLRKSEARYRALVTASAQDVWRTDERGEAFFVTSTWREMTGQSLEQANGFGWLDAVHPDDRANCIAAWKKAEEEKGCYQNEFRVRTVDGQYRTFQSCGVPVLSSDGSISEWIGANTDVTERKRIEQSLRESEERFRLVALATRDGIYDCDLRTLTVWRNETYQRLFSDGESSELTTEWWEGHIHPKDRERIRKSFDHACQTQSHFWSDEYSFRKPDGTYAMVMDRGYILFDDAGQALRVIGVVADITERRLANEALQKREDELNKSNAQIRELARRLMTAQEEERRRISRQLHDDLNQKVAALSIAFSAIKQQLPANLNGLNNRLDMVDTLCGQIAEGMRRLSHELHPAVLEHVGLAAALKVHLAEVSIREGVQISLALGANVDAIPQDAAVCLYRVAQESLRNVVKHSGVKSAQVALSVDHQGVHLHVSDNGLGFDLAAARNNCGVGLASMEERVQLMQGSFQIATEPGRGSKLMATIPLRKIAT